MTDPSAAPPRRLELETGVAASPERVWQALTDPVELARWFPVAARVTPGLGGSIFLSWGAGVEGEAPISVWEPNRRFGWAEEHPGAHIAVEFQLEAGEGATVVRLVQSGFGAGDDWDEHYDAVGHGWTYFLWNLQLYLERHAGTPRDLVWLRRKGGAPRAEVWARLWVDGGLLAGAAPGATPGQGDPFRLALAAADQPTGTVRFAAPGRAFAGLVEGLEDAPLFVELESGGENWHCGVWLSTYGLDARRLETVRARLGETADRLFAPGTAAAVSRS